MTDEKKEQAEHPGKEPGEGEAPAQGTEPGETSIGDGGDSEATGSGPSGGAPSTGGETGDSSATGAGGSGGAE